jgi:hypothetical protein
MRARLSVAGVLLAVPSLTGAASTNIQAEPPSKTFEVPLTAQAEDGDLHALHLAGDEDASGQVELTVDPDTRRICYDFHVSGLATPLMAHIHKGAPHESGPSVVTLFTGPGKMHDCLTWTQKWVDQIAAHPAGFYVNLYTTEFPEGALRGQLAA